MIKFKLSRVFIWTRKSRTPSNLEMETGQEILTQSRTPLKHLCSYGSPRLLLCLHDSPTSICTDTNCASLLCATPIAQPLILYVYVRSSLLVNRNQIPVLSCFSHRIRPPSRNPSSPQALAIFTNFSQPPPSPTPSSILSQLQAL